jgi:SAM-dependent methyltransferase
MISESRRYFAEDFASVGEHERLAVLEGNYDPGTFRLLEDCGVAPGWRCSEVGAGRGSVAAWLAHAVGPEGSIVALDIDTSHLDHLARRSNVELRQHDIVAEPIGEASFDLVQTRLVIEHLPEPERLLEMLAKATRPGGVLVVECTDMLATAAADPSDPRSRTFDEFMAMSLAAGESMSTFDFGFARRLPQLSRARLRRERKPSRRTGRARRRFQSARVRIAGCRHAVNPDRARARDGGRDRRIPGQPRRPRFLVRGEQRCRCVGPATQVSPNSWRRAAKPMDRPEARDS